MYEKGLIAEVNSPVKGWDWRLFGNGSTDVGGTSEWMEKITVAALSGQVYWKFLINR